MDGDNYFGCPSDMECETCGVVKELDQFDRSGICFECLSKTADLVIVVLLTLLGIILAGFVFLSFM